MKWCRVSASKCVCPLFILLFEWYQFRKIILWCHRFGSLTFQESFCFSKIYHQFYDDLKWILTIWNVIWDLTLMVIKWKVWELKYLLWQDWMKLHVVVFCSNSKDWQEWRIYDDHIEACKSIMCAIYILENERSLLAEQNRL